MLLNMIIFIFLVFSFVDVCEMSRRKSYRDVIVNRPQRDDFVVNPIWPEDKPTSDGHTAQVYMNYVASGTYYVETEIGDPPQEVKMLISSSADYTTLKTTKCTDCEGTLYNGGESTTALGWNETSETITVKTAGGDYEGSVIKDHVGVGDLTAVKVKILAARKGSKVATKGDHDGVLSFKYETGDRGFFHRLMQIEDLKKTVVTFVFLQNRHKKIDEQAGIIWLGTRNPDYFTEPMAYSYINSPYWVVGLQSFTIDEVEFCVEGPCLGYISLEEEFVLIHNRFYTTILETTKGRRFEDGKIMVDCETRSGLPPIRFQIGGEKFRLLGDEYVIKENQECLTVFKLDDNIKELEFVLGTHFHERFYLELGLYKFGNAVSRGVGLAKRKYSIT